eukprot:TRINITY_DN4078_c0_g3_i1.p1 TRINITY_DN4078_c0_g3~~TRINITY_DN4078_c0_g3_i1.p1  ORF type:complete len:412 (+),score=141.35 TRINITY_DN4078_c0_g3_i1:247-1482(+)
MFRWDRNGVRHTWTLFSLMGKERDLSLQDVEQRTILKGWVAFKLQPKVSGTWTPNTKEEQDAYAAYDAALSLLNQETEVQKMQKVLEEQQREKERANLRMNTMQKDINLRMAQEQELRGKLAQSQTKLKQMTAARNNTMERLNVELLKRVTVNSMNRKLEKENLALSQMASQPAPAGRMYDLESDGESYPSEDEVETTARPNTHAGGELAFHEGTMGKQFWAEVRFSAPPGTQPDAMDRDVLMAGTITGSPSIRLERPHIYSDAHMLCMELDDLHREVVFWWSVGVRWLMWARNLYIEPRSDDAQFGWYAPVGHTDAIDLDGAQEWRHPPYVEDQLWFFQYKQHHKDIKVLLDNEDRGGMVRAVNVYRDIVLGFCSSTSPEDWGTFEELEKKMGTKRPHAEAPPSKKPKLG